MTTETYDLDTDLRLRPQILVQNRVAIATPRLPPEVQRDRCRGQKE